MAKANPVINAVLEYLMIEFPIQGELNLEQVLDTSKSRVVFTYLEVKAALQKMMLLDPEIHRILAYRWQSNRSRNDIANALHYDSSTVRRRWIKGVNILLNYLVNKEVTVELEPIDIRMKEFKSNGILEVA